LPVDGFEGGLTTGVSWFKAILGVDIHTAQRPPTNKGNGGDHPGRRSCSFMQNYVAHRRTGESRMFFHGLTVFMLLAVDTSTFADKNESYLVVQPQTPPRIPTRGEQLTTAGLLAASVPRG
jgi:hypothetical protein